MIKRLMIGVLGVIGLFGLTIIYALFLDPRPEDTTDPRIYVGDPRAIDYCVKAPLDGSTGITADDIPKSYTPGFGWDGFPTPILAGCSEPLPPEADDLRGLWQAVDGKVGHVERIEQCGNRFLVVGGGVNHEARTTGLLKDAVNDVNPLGFRIKATMVWAQNEQDEKVLNFQPWGLPYVIVSRRLAGPDTLVWVYGDGETSTLKRICQLPPAKELILPGKDRS